MSSKTPPAMQNALVLSKKEMEKLKAEELENFEEGRLPAGRSGRCGPTAKHLIDSPRPFYRTRCGKLLYASCSRSLASPHGRFGSKELCVFGDQVSVAVSSLLLSGEFSRSPRWVDSRILDLCQQKPAVIPAPSAGRVIHDSMLRLVKALGTEWIVLRKTT